MPTDRARIVNVAEMAEPGWRFVADALPGMLDWRFHDARPRNGIERAIRRPRLARYRAALGAALDARDGDVLLSHMPIMTAAVADMARRIGRRPRHMAVSFNFTELPHGARLDRMRRAFGHVDRFLVYSRAEQLLYPALFDLPADRFAFLHWPMDKPAAGPRPAFLPPLYAVAAGGEARDHATLLAAARMLPHVPLVIATRPGHVARETLPAHVTLLENLSGADFWSTVAHARISLVPLRDGETNCGHITLVGSQLLGSPIVATRSAGIADYVEDGVNASLVAPGDARALAGAIDTLWNDDERRVRHATTGKALAAQRSAPDAMIEEVRRFISG